MNSYITNILRHWRPVAVFNSVILLFAFISAQSVDKVWMAEAQLILPNSTDDLNLDLGTLGELGGGEGLTFTPQVDSRQILASILLSNDLLERVRELDPEKAAYPGIGSYKTLFDVETDSASTVISLSAEGLEPTIARDRLAIFIDVFQNRLIELRSDNVQNRSDFVQEALIEAKTNLTEAGQALSSFQTETNLINLDSQSSELVNAISQLVLIQGEATAEFQANQARLSSLSERLGQTPEQAILALDLSENGGYQSIQAELSKLEVELLEARALSTDQHPQVLYLLAQREKLLRQQERYILDVAGSVEGVNPSIGQGYAALIQQMILAESEARALGEQASQLQTQLDQLNGRLLQFPSAKARFAELQRDYDIAQGVYNGLMAQIQANRVNALSTYPSVQILDQPATTSGTVGSGRKPIVLGAMLASIFGSFAIIAYLESRNPLVPLKDFQSTAFPILRYIPYLKQDITFGDFSLGSGEFQRLASTLSMAHQKSWFVIASPDTGEGKTTVTIGLAKALKFLGFRVLMVDADFHNHHLSKQLGYPSRTAPVLFEASPTPIPIEPGLDLLSRTVIKTESRRARFGCARELVEAVKAISKIEQYDYVLFDTAAIAKDNETVILAKEIESVLMVVWAGKTRKRAFYDSLGQLEAHRIKRPSLIINGTNAPTTHHHNYSSDSAPPAHVDNGYALTFPVRSNDA